MRKDARREDAPRISSPFEGERVRLRARDEEDLPALNEMFNEPDVQAGLTIAWPQPMAGIRSWLESTRTAEDQVVFAIETIDGELIGVCGLEGIEDRSRQANLGIWVGKTHWDQGYGTDAMRVLCRFGFHHMNLQRIQLDVYEVNERARAVYERVGFTYEGTRRRGQFVGGRYVDALVMGLLAEEFHDR